MQVVCPWEQPKAAPLTSKPTGNGPSSDARDARSRNFGKLAQEKLYVCISKLLKDWISFPAINCSNLSKFLSRG